ncbi:MAG: deoxyribodipyrimidine photo-lyase [Bacteroidetes bacterium]|nr:deoxyribodipyrimidine photo-lyase [Bacteroidota bacterium]
MAHSPSPVVAFWFRRDLRLDDNTGLVRALQSGQPVLPVFIFDRHILDQLQDRDDARVSFIHRQLHHLDQQLRRFGSRLLVGYGTPLELWKDWVVQYGISAVYTNRDYEPYAIRRDREVAGILAELGTAFHTFKDQVVFERDEVIKPDGGPYAVFTPYSRRWKQALAEDPPTPATIPPEGKWCAAVNEPIPTLDALGFAPSSIPIPEPALPTALLKAYAERRNFPGQPGTSRLGIHLRFGTLSIRKLVLEAQKHSETFLNELIWREFYQMILFHHPQVVQKAFKPAYDRIVWRQSPEDFERWKAGKTGYPLVDAGMRELAETGFMHNRVRMVVASFLTKHLLLDWRLGEAWFAQKLLDFELASNSGGWQWAAGCGCDAAPYFRVFNPSSQAAKFDPGGAYIVHWVPEYGTPAYPQPMVEHAFARERVLKTFKAALAVSSV